MKKTLLAMRDWTTDRAGIVGAFLLVLAGFVGGYTYGQASASLTIAQINATHAAEIQSLSEKFGQTIEKKDGTSRELVRAVAKKLQQDEDKPNAK